MDTSWSDGDEIFAVADGRPSDVPVVFRKYLDPQALTLTPPSGYGTITTVAVGGVALAGGLCRFTIASAGVVAYSNATAADGGDGDGTSVSCGAPAVYDPSTGLPLQSVIAVVDVSMNGVHYTSTTPPLQFFFILGAPIDMTMLARLSEDDRPRLLRPS